MHDTDMAIRVAVDAIRRLISEERKKSRMHIKKNDNEKKRAGEKKNGKMNGEISGKINERK